MSQAKIRLIAIDVDGTLLNGRHRVEPAVAVSLREQHQRGTKIVLATARSPQLMGAVLAELGFLPLLICFSGAWIGDPNLQSIQQKPFYQRELSAMATEQVIDIGLSCHLEPNVFYPFEWRVRKLTTEVMTESDITQVKPFVSSELLEGSRCPSKILLISKPGDTTAAIQRVASEVCSFTTATFSKPNYLEIIAPGVNKARSLALLAERLGFDMSATAAIGDGLNDLEMIESSAFGVAMGNAQEEVKSAADWVTSSHDEAGVAAAIQELSRRRLI
ncbi:MAG TPA: Cof-type HAD-IIB family hydrolase [Chthoniobacterales bacterium]|nr:Cof-type HAD-IIB family hydrolase [Chthoniobacterales bacterium]